MLIRQMKDADVDFAFGLASEEGWASETREVFEGFIEYDRGGCFVAEENSERIGICVAVRYPRSGFIGELIVKMEARGKGYGKTLFRHAVAYLRSKGVVKIALDAVDAAAPIYEKEGFRKICRSLRFVGRIDGRENRLVRKAQPGDIDDIIAIDGKLFGDDRSFFVRRRMALFPDLCFVLDNEGIRGYAMGRPGVGLFSVGPFVCQGGDVDPLVLVEGLAMETGGGDMRFCALETCERAVNLFRTGKIFEERNPCWRMACGPYEELRTGVDLLATGSGAKG